MNGNKGLIGFLIAVLVAAISFLIYWFFFKKKNVDPLYNAGMSAGALGGAAGSIATNPISPQDTTASRPEYIPVNPPTEIGDGGYVSILSPQSDGFKSSPQESLTSGNSLAQRSNNPGALFWDGSTNWQGLDKSKSKSGQIIYFDNSDYGVRAQLMTLKNYSKKHGINTLIGITSRYAPYGHGDNDPAAYARTLASNLCIDVDTKFDMDVNRNMLAAVGYYIHRVEAGYYWIPREKYLEWAQKV